MNTISSSGQDYILGLTWSRISVDNFKSEVDLTIKEYKTDIGLIRKTSDRAQIGLIDDKTQVGKHSAAAMLAECTDNIVYVTKVLEEKFWVVGILSGEVLSGSDVLVGEETAASLIDEFAGLTSLEGESLNIVVDENAIGFLEIDNIDGTATFEQLTEGKKPLPSTKIKALKSKFKQIAIAGATIAIVAGIGFGFKYKMDMDKAAEMAALDAMLAAKNQKNNEGLPAGAVEKQAREEEQEWLKMSFLHTHGQKYLENTLQEFLSLGGTQRGGWKLSSFKTEFGVGQTPQIETRWEKVNGNIKSLKDLELSTSYQVSNDGKNIVGFKSNGSVDLVGLVNEIDIYNEIIKTSGNIDDLMDHLDKLKITYALGEKESSEREEVVINSTIQNDRIRRLPYTKRFIEMRGDGLENLKHVVKESNQNGKLFSLTLKEINITPAKTISWNIIGEIYEN